MFDRLRWRLAVLIYPELRQTEDRAHELWYLQTVLLADAHWWLGRDFPLVREVTGWLQRSFRNHFRRLDQLYEAGLDGQPDDIGGLRLYLQAKYLQGKTNQQPQ